MTATPQRLDLMFRIEWEGTWHVGSGSGAVQADRLIRRRGGRGGMPFVPGSQLKGVLRHQAERLAAALGREVVSPHATGRDQQEGLVRHFRPLNDSALLVDRLFGSRYQGECLFVDVALAPPRGASRLACPRFASARPGGDGPPDRDGQGGASVRDRGRRGEWRHTPRRGPGGLLPKNWST